MCARGGRIIKKTASVRHIAIPTLSLNPCLLSFFVLRCTALPYLLWSNLLPGSCHVLWWYHMGHRPPSHSSRWSSLLVSRLSSSLFPSLPVSSSFISSFKPPHLRHWFDIRFHPSERYPFRFHPSSSWVVISLKLLCANSLLNLCLGNGVELLNYSGLLNNWLIYFIILCASELLNYPLCIRIVG